MTNASLDGIIVSRILPRGLRLRKPYQYLALLLLAVLASSPVAQAGNTPPDTTPLTYNDGDLFLGFRATDRTVCYLVNIFQPTPFVSAAPGASFQVATGNTSIDLTTAFGSDWYTRIDPNTGSKAVQWAVMGGRQVAGLGDVANTLYSTNPLANPWPARSDTAQSFTSSLIAAMGGTFAGNNPTPNNPNGLIQNVASSNSYRSFQPGGANSGGISFQTWNPADEAEPDGSLSFDRIAPGACSTELGTLTLNSFGQVNFTAVLTPAPIVISGKASYCSNATLPGVPNVTMTLTGSSSGSTVSDGSGNYSFPSLPSGGNYVITPSKAGLAPGTVGINTVDVIATQRHFLNLGPPLTGCRLTAADVNGVGGINTVDVIAIQRFFLTLTTGVANVGRYQFSPVSRTFFGVFCNRTGQNFDALVFGDVASSFVHRPGGSSELDTSDDGSSVLANAVTTVALPEGEIDASLTEFIAEVTTSYIDPKNNIVGFQGDFVFDERVVSFEVDPVQNAGMTAGNWTVSGNVLAGSGPIRTVRVSAFSNDFRPLAGSGMLFELRMKRVNKSTQPAQLLWAEPPGHFIFIDADLNTHIPRYTVPGYISTSKETTSENDFTQSLPSRR